jgi:chromodomain-helicase-DNA-binding protein 7
LMINSIKDRIRFPFALSLLAAADSPEFDPTFENLEKAERVDAEFVNRGKILRPDLAHLRAHSPMWLQTLEAVALVAIAVEKANRNVSEIAIPEVQAAVPGDGWTENDDRYLIYGTWKHGFGRFKLSTDPDIVFTDVWPRPTGQSMRSRLIKLADGFRELFSLIPKPGILATPWTPAENARVIRQLRRGGVPLAPDGSHDWEKFREICDLPIKTAAQCERAVNALIDVPDALNDDADESEDSDFETADDVLAVRPLSEKMRREIKARFHSLTALRRVFMKYTDEQLTEYFLLMPRGPPVPGRLTGDLEFVFFKEISKRGWGFAREILRMPAFEGIFKGTPPDFFTTHPNMIRRLNFALRFIVQNTLEALRERDVRTRLEPEKPKGIHVPEIAYDGNGDPVLPIRLSEKTSILALGTIVTDRPGFHAKNYIYPAGFKSSRLFPSTLDESENARYISEIVDTGGEAPIFRVTMEDHPEISFEGKAMHSGWSALSNAVADKRGGRPIQVPGAAMYGLASPVTLYLIQEMEGADKCEKYIRRQFSPSPVKQD